MSQDLTALRDDPFELLCALEARLTGGGEHGGAARADWVGLGFYMDGEAFLAPQSEVREILKMPRVTRVPGAKPWLVGVANVRGELLPITDLAGFLGTRETAVTDASRVIVLNEHELPVALLVDSLAGFHSFTRDDQRHEMLQGINSGAVSPFLLGAFVREGITWKVFSLRKLAADPSFRNAGSQDPIGEHTSVQD